jgi:hypothetical protein
MVNHHEILARVSGFAIHGLSNFASSGNAVDFMRLTVSP